MAAIRGDRTLAEIAQQHDVDRNQIQDWKQRLISKAEQAPHLGTGDRPRDPSLPVQGLNHRPTQPDLYLGTGSSFSIQSVVPVRIRVARMDYISHERIAPRESMMTTRIYPGPDVRGHVSAKISSCLLWTMAFVLVLPFGPSARADEREYRFLSVRTILGPCCTDAGYNLLVDDDDAVFVVGYRGGLDLDRDGAIDVPSHGSPDPLVLKTFEHGDQGGWVDDLGGPGQERATAVAVDHNGGVYVVGNFERSIRIGPHQLTAEGGNDGFLARYDREGTVLWAVAIGGTEPDDLRGVASDEAGNVYVLGTIHGPVDVDRDGRVDVAPSSESALLLASFTPQGRLLWAHASAGSAAARAMTVASGLEGEIYISGFYRAGTVDLDADGEPEGPEAGGSGTVTPESDLNAFFARFDTAGEMHWSRFVSGPGTQIVGTLAIAGNGDLIVGGSYTGPVDLDADGVPDLEFESLSDSRQEHGYDSNTLLLRMTPAGDRIWARRYKVAGGYVTADATRIAMNGIYNGDLDFDEDGIPERAADPDEGFESFIAILDGDGELLKLFTVVGEDDDMVAATAFSPDGSRLYATGYTKLGADYDGDGRIEFASECHQLGDYFLAVYDVDD